MRQPKTVLAASTASAARRPSLRRKAVAPAAAGSVMSYVPGSISMGTRQRAEGVRTEGGRGFD